MAETTCDVILGGRLSLIQPARGQRAGSDAILVGSCVPARAGDLVADFGAGIGSVGLAVLARVPGARAVLVEIEPQAAELARQNVLANGFADHAQVLTADVANLGRGETENLAASFDHVVANPPFHPESGRASPDPATALARIATPGLIEDWSRAAARLLKPGGTFTVIHRPDALAHLLSALAGRFGGLVVRFVHGKANEAAVRVLIQGTKGSRAPLRVLPAVILNASEGGLTPEAEAIHRNLASLSMA